jgi:hypothetical protein
MIDTLESIDQYRLVKLGKFSASEINKLFVSGRRDMTDAELMAEKAKGGKRKTVDTYFGDTAISYIRKTAKNHYLGKTNEDEDIETKAMRIGKMKEPEAFRYYASIMPSEYGYIHYGETNPVFKPHPLFPNDAGCTSDCVATGPFGAAWVTDFKCPTSNTHFSYLLDIKDGNSLKEYCFDYWAQGQMNMICHDTHIFHWVSYHEDFEPRNRLHIIELERDKDFERELTERLAEAIKIKYEILQNLKQI